MMKRLLLLLVLPMLLVACGGSSKPAVSVHPRVLSHHLTVGLRPETAGAPVVGEVLTTSNGTWTNSPTSFAYQWQRCSSGACANITGATTSSYTVATVDLGDTIDVTVTATNAGGSATQTSAPTGVVTAAPPPSHQVFANYLGWATNLGTNLPFADVTQFVMFALDTENGTGINASMNEVSSYNLPNWTGTIHSHGDQAWIAIGGSNDGNWANACNPTNQAGFVANLVSYAVTNGFDGIDIDAEQSVGTAAQFESCVQAIANAAHAATSKQGKPIQVSEEMDESLYNSLPYSTIPTDISYLDQVQLEYFGYNPTTDWNCGSGSPADTCAYVTSMVKHATGEGLPASKLLIGMEPDDGAAQGAFSNITTTNAAVSTATVPTSIPVASITTAIAAGDIVLQSTEKPPAEYDVLTTSGAAVCSSSCSIPITGTVYTNEPGGFTFPSGSDVDSAYMGPWDCYNLAHYAASNGMKGNMTFDLQGEYSGYSNNYPCLANIAYGLGLTSIVPPL